jgi:hypothetical protein
VDRALKDTVLRDVNYALAFAVVLAIPVSAVPLLYAGILAACYFAPRQAVHIKFAITPGRCPRCRYDCASLPATAPGLTRCPECGGDVTLAIPAGPPPPPPG